MKVQETATFLYLLSQLLPKDRYDKNNPFAKILSGEAETELVYEDKYAVAFKSTGAQVKKHFLVIPKVPAVDLTDFMEKASPEQVNGYMKAIQEVAHRQGMSPKSELMAGTSELGYRVTFNTGVHGRQTVPHCHAHVMGGEQLQPHFIGITQEKVDQIKEQGATEACHTLLGKLENNGMISKCVTAQNLARQIVKTFVNSHSRNG